MEAALNALQNIKLDGSALYSPSQHAIAGQAALGLAQLTEQDSHLIAPPEETLNFISNLNQFAQKAETSRRILERYLIGTEINRVDPVSVPFQPQSAQMYPVPATDASVLKSEHLPYDMNSKPTNLGSYQGLLNQIVSRSSFSTNSLLYGFAKPRESIFNSFI